MPEASSEAASSSQKGPLSGIRVLDLSRVLAGPWSAQILGDLGAEVIKIEHPVRGDDTRAWGPPYISDDSEGLSAYYLCVNRNKRSVGVDMSTAEGAGVIKKLARECDIVVENFKVGGLKKYGLDYQGLRQENPKIIYCSVTGFGQDGPYAPRGGYDFLIQGMSGLMSTTGLPDGTPGEGPLKLGVPVADLSTGLFAVISILAALRHRDATGTGQHIDCSLLDSQIAMIGPHAQNILVGGKQPKRMGNLHPNVVPYRTFSCKDGHVIVAVGSDRQYQGLCRMLNRMDLAEDDDYTINANRLKNRDKLEAQLGEIIAKWTTEEMTAGMAEYGVPGGPIHTLEQVFDDPQVRHRKMAGEITGDRGESVPYVRFPAVFSESPPVNPSAPPRLGQHTDEILTGILGMTEKEIEELRQTGTISGPDTDR